MSGPDGDPLPPRNRDENRATGGRTARFVPDHHPPKPARPTPARTTPATSVPTPSRGSKARNSTTSASDFRAAGPDLVERILFGRVSSGPTRRLLPPVRRVHDAGVDIGKSLANLQS